MPNETFEQPTAALAATRRRASATAWRRAAQCLAMGVAIGLGAVAATPAARADVVSPFHPTSSQGTFLVLSDIHFDPFGDTKLVQALAKAKVEQWPALLAKSATAPVSRPGSDSNYALMQSALDAAAKLKVDYVLVGGDLLSHQFEKNATAALGSTGAAKDFATKTTEFVARQIDARFAKVPVIPALGNNDSDCGDYAIEPDGGYLARLAKTWRLFATNSDAARAFARTGSFWIWHPTVKKHKMLVVNDIFLSDEYSDVCKPQVRDPGVATLDWLTDSLDAMAAAGEQATLLFHIPPGFDGFASALDNASCKKAVPLWQPQFAARFAKLADRRRATIAGAFAGHLHSDGFRVFGAATKQPYLPIHVVPAVSPIFGNNPSFSQYLYRKSDGAPLDSAVFYLPVAKSRPTSAWQLEYTAKAEYRLKGIDADGLSQLSRWIATPSDPAATAFRRNFDVSAKVKISPTTWTSYLCAQTNFDAASFTACRCAVK